MINEFDFNPGLSHMQFTLGSVFFSSFQSGKAHQVSQFHIVNWNADGRCSNLKTITDVIEEVTKVQMRTGNNPIVVHCRWGYEHWLYSVFVQPLVAAECCT